MARQQGWRRSVGTLAFLGLGICVAAMAVASGSAAARRTDVRGVAAAKSVSVWFSPYAFSNDYSIGEMNGAKAAAAHFHASLKMVDSGFVAATQSSQIEDAVHSGRYQAIVVAPDDGVSIVPALKDAIAAHIKVVCIGSPCGPNASSIKPQIPGQLAFVGEDGVTDGSLWATMFHRACGRKNPCDVGVIAGYYTNTSDIARDNALKAGLKKYPNIHWVATGQGQFSENTGYKVAQNMLTAHPNLVAVATANDATAFGLQRAAQQAGRHVKIISNAVSVQGLEAVASGKWFGDTVWLPYNEGYLGVKLAIQAAESGKVKPQGINIRLQSPIGPLVTKQNASKLPKKDLYPL